MQTTPNAVSFFSGLDFTTLTPQAYAQICQSLKMAMGVAVADIYANPSLTADQVSLVDSLLSSSLQVATIPSTNTTNQTVTP